MKNTRLFAYLFVPTLTSLGLLKLLAPRRPEVTLLQDVETGDVTGRPICPHEHFGLPGMFYCHKWLTCTEIENEVKIQEPLENGAVKAVFLAKWMDHVVVYNAMLTPKYHDDFQHGLKMISALQPYPEIIQLIGHCNNVFITEYHKFGTAANLAPLLETKLQMHNTLAIRFGFCLQYAKLIKFFHTSPIGTRVMCDSNDLQKTLSQYLVTSDLWLIANDLDAFPKVNKKEGHLIKCGHRQLSGDFVAPEQRWVRKDTVFDDSQMPGYDEMTDIWKIPDVCEHFLGNVTGADNLRFHLFDIHKQCKQTNSQLRPSADRVAEEYLRIQEEFELQ